MIIISLKICPTLTDCFKSYFYFVKMWKCLCVSFPLRQLREYFISKTLLLFQKYHFKWHATNGISIFYVPASRVQLVFRFSCTFIKY